MASSLSRCCYKTAQNHIIFRLLNPRFALHNRFITTSKPPPPPSTTSPSPWLMLPPVFEGGDVRYKFYSPTDDKNLHFNINGGRRHAKLVGSSHGWLALFDENSNHIFLSNPISDQHVKLPPIDTLPDPDVNLLAGRGQVSKVILSCSPEEADCRALMSFGPKDRLAFCAPRAASASWIPIGDLYSDEGYEDRESLPYRRGNTDRHYEDFVYSTRDDRFFCITEHNTMLEAWDLRDPLSPKIDWTFPHCDDLTFALDIYPWPCRTKQEWAFIDKCAHPKYLAFSDHSDDLFVVVRHVVRRMRPDGSSAKLMCMFGYGNTWDHRYPYKTIEFDVFKVDQKTRKLKYMEGSLEGLAIFVGMNHSFAVLATEFPELKADSVYFTDEDRRITPNWLARTGFGGHDNGIFDYRDRTISSICSDYPVEYEKITRIVPPPMWFNPCINTS